MKQPSASVELESWCESGRIVDLAGAPGDGPDVVIVAGLHGNEPDGVTAGKAVISAIRASGAEVPGRVVLVAGNLGALREEQRFLDRDLNRGWRLDAIEGVRNRRPDERCREDVEQLALIDCLEALARSARHGLVFLDLHTTSGGTPPFSVIIDAQDNWSLGEAIGYPVVLGFERHVDSPILVWLEAQGWPAVGVEGGSCGERSAAGNLALAAWRLLGALGWPLEQARVASTPGPALRIVYRHSVVPGSRFRMAPGFESFQPVRHGQVLASDSTGQIRAIRDGLMFMPLYQSQGSDGFFLLAEAAVGRDA